MRERSRLADMLWLAVAGATLASVVHVSVVYVTYYLFNTLTFTSLQFAWLAWFGSVALFLIAVPFVAALTYLLPRKLGLLVPALLFGTMAFLDMALLIPRLHPAAHLVLALGLATRASAIVRRDPGRWMPYLRRGTLAGMTLLAGLGLAVNSGRWYSEWQNLATLPAARAGAPNVILLVLDTVRAANLSVYGYARPTTPNLERLALEGTVFEKAFSVSPWTAPSHASLMTGLYGVQTGAGYLDPMSPTAVTVAEVLHASGYVTGAFMGNPGYAGYQIGLARGFSHYEDYPPSARNALMSSTLAQTGLGNAVFEAFFSRDWRRLRRAVIRPSLRVGTVKRTQAYTAAQIARNFVAWRDGIDPGRPYFAMLNFMDAHAPYQPPDGFSTRFGDGSRELDGYDGGIAYMDGVIGQLTARLRDRGDLDRTILIVTSDHGEQWGEHGLGSHGNSLYLPVLHVPLIVRAPGSVPAAGRQPAVVSLRDIAATIVDLAGGPAGRLPGASLASIWRTGHAAGVSPVVADATPVINPAARNLTRFGPIVASLDSAWHYIRYGNATEELFNWRDDPAEANNLISTPAGAAEAVRHRAIIEKQLGIHVPAPTSGPVK